MGVPERVLVGISTLASPDLYEIAHLAFHRAGRRTWPRRVSPEVPGWASGGCGVHVSGQVSGDMAPSCFNPRMH